MKKALVYLILISFFSCSDDEAPKQAYTITGSVNVGKNDGDPVPLSNAKLKIAFFTETGPMTLKEGESTTVLTDSQGKYQLEINLPVNGYQAYTVSVDDQYYHSCTGVTTPLIMVDYKALDPGANEADLLVCHTGNVKVIADKVSSGSSNTLTIINKATKGSTTFLDAGVTIDSDKEMVFPFYDGVSDVEFTFQKKTNNVITQEDDTPVEIVPGTTVVVEVTF
jgi:hypothetical protein